MNLASMMAAFLSVLACVATTQAFVMPGVGGAAARFSNSLIQHKPNASPVTGSRSSGSSAVGALNYVKIVVGEDENVESALLRFRRTVSKAGHLQDLRHKRYFETAQERRKRKDADNRRKDRIQRNRERKAQQYQF